MSHTKPAPQSEFEEISKIAYHLWRQADCPSGRDLEFWIQAEQQAAGRPTGQNTRVTTTDKKRQNRAAPKTSNGTKSAVKRSPNPTGNGSAKPESQAAKKISKAR
jgi:hypothetical protein